LGQSERELTQDRIIQAAAGVIDAARVGVLSTVDAHGQPRGRYMAAVAENDGVSRLYALSAKETHKVEEIRRNPLVCWTFMAAPDGAVVSIYGSASVHETTVLSTDVWNHLREIVQPYAINVASDQRHHAFVAVVTRATALDYLDPASGVAQPEHVSLT
jgi:pyridoxamine 5'-phosphate oxidase